jgi:hypothetical protein
MEDASAVDLDWFLEAGFTQLILSTLVLGMKQYYISDTNCSTERCKSKGRFELRKDHLYI